MPPTTTGISPTPSSRILRSTSLTSGCASRRGWRGRRCARPPRRGVGDAGGGETDALVDELDAGIARRHGDLLGTVAVAVEAGLADQHLEAVAEAGAFATVDESFSNDRWTPIHPWLGNRERAQAMREVHDFVDERQKAWCIHCARSLAGLETNQDHVPSKSLLQVPRPHHLPIVRICRECNAGFSLDEQYAVTFLSCVLAGSTGPAKQPNASAGRPLSDSPSLRAQIERSRTEFVTMGGETRILWTPDMERIKRVVLKNARGHVYFEHGEPIFDAPVHVSIVPLESLTGQERRDCEGPSEEGSLASWPEVGSRMMTRLLTGEDMAGKWVVVQEGSTRYSVQQCSNLRVRSVLYDYLATEVQWRLHVGLGATEKPWS